MSDEEEFRAIDDGDLALFCRQNSWSWKVRVLIRKRMVLYLGLLGWPLKRTLGRMAQSGQEIPSRAQKTRQQMYSSIRPTDHQTPMAKIPL